jgi:hypothetical protein
MVKLTPVQQSKFVAQAPKVFAPVPGGWGRRGSTNVMLAGADASAVKSALATAWENVAPNSLAARDDRRSGNSGAAPRATGGDTDRDLVRAFAPVQAAVRAAKLPEVEEGVSFGTPCLKVRGKFLMRIKDPETLVFRCPIDEKIMLTEAAPDIYFETAHYVGWPAVLVRLSRISQAELVHCLERAWRLQAPAKLVAQREGKVLGNAKRRTRRAP